MSQQAEVGPGEGCQEAEPRLTLGDSSKAFRSSINVEPRACPISLSGERVLQLVLHKLLWMILIQMLGRGRRGMAILLAIPVQEK